MAGLGLFDYWVITITWSTVFLLLVSLFLYSKRKKPAGAQAGAGRLKRSIVDFTFVWVLMALLVFYIVTIYLESFVLFALGNVVVEIFLVYYVFRNRVR
ncbi:MAG TPA: hypothetical protein VMS77_08320 [Conexivisphaerales archaeon]|nr:hypothetical protein [Conexivisphaerales archaeon]